MFLKPKEQVDSTESKIVDNLRALSIDMIHEANSGHPGICLGAAPILYTLYAKHLRIQPEDSKWLNRDRFILSAGHASSLLYATLYMAGFPLELEDLKAFRKIHSKTPGHPEYGITEGVEMSTGPLGEGVSSAVGMAIAEAYLREYYQKKNKNLFHYYTYVLCSDGDLMEGSSYEAFSLAGTLKLNQLIVLYDSNKISLDGKVSQTYTVDLEKYFQSLNWNTITVDGEDFVALDNAITKAKSSNLPTFIIVNTTIGKYSQWEGSNQVHGTPLTEEDITSIKNKLNIRDIPFTVSSEAKEEMQAMIQNRMKKEYENWQAYVESLDDDTKQQLVKMKENDLSLDHLNIHYEVSQDETESLRESSHKILNSLAENNPFFLGGSADLSSSVLTRLDQETDYSSENRLGRNLNYGVREHAMGAIMNGISLSGIRNFGSTYLAFSDFLKPSLRLACQMNLANIYLFSHDSISVGKDGPTHQPIEQLVSLRATPNLEVYRPADANEMIGTYKVVASKKQGPSAILLGRNRTKVKTNTSINDVSKGAYIVKKEANQLSAILIASGEELDLALEVALALEQKGYQIRVISMPCMELFQKQKPSYQQELLPTGVKVFVIEASSSYSWNQYVSNQNYLITVDQFGYSGEKEEVLAEFGFTKEKIVEKIETLLR